VKRILGIDTSCDDTSAAVVDDTFKILSNIVSGQEHIHKKYLGVVPELASRRHIEMIWPVVAEALQTAGISAGDVDAVAVCKGPGLIGSLLVGVSFAKALSFGIRKPLIGVNHLEGHIYANFLEPTPPSFPFLALVVSGGHTSVYHVTACGHYEEVSRTLDDAAGEAYDKVAKLLEIGFPGGPVIDRLAHQGNPDSIRFPKPLLHGRSEFSFSGLKTAVLYHHRNNPNFPVQDTAAAFQRSVVEVLVEKTLRLATARNVTRVVLSGGVSANSELRRRMMDETAARGMQLYLPSPSLCTDNAGMIAAAAFHRLEAGVVDGLSLKASAFLPLGSTG